MKTWIQDILISILMGIVFPGMVLNFAAACWKGPPQTVTAVSPQEQVWQSVPLVVKIRSSEGTVSEGDMDTYVVGVVLAEMPAYFETEALRAQSVVARTYARKALATGGKHADGSVCTQSACCQGWISQEDYLQAGGSQENVDRVREAVLSTSGQVLTYDGELIEATYFSCSGGSTEDALAVWGTDFPYLRAVDSPGEENAAHYQDTAVFSREELERRLDVRLTGSPETWIGSVSYTKGGGVDTAAIGGRFFTGKELRAKLGLCSTAFTVTATQNAVTITTKGFGHRVGMSQYGADAMAADGRSYQEILAWYYPGTQLESLKAEPILEETPI